MKRNTDPAFKGIQALKDMQREQLDRFIQADAIGDYRAIHDDHYDWWMFPIDEPSGYGWAWTVGEGDVAELKEDPDYLARYRRGLELLARAWGWDLSRGEYLADPGPDQCWQHWPIRLYKATRSASLFGCQAEFESLRKLGKDLLSKGESMVYRRDLSGIFRD